MKTRVVDLIVKKRDGHPLEKREIDFLISGYVEGKVPDYQMAAFLMAVVKSSMSDTETALFTDAVIRSGATIDLAPIGKTVVDKHSTGGVGDKVSIALSPIVAACGVPVGKMSGRGLGFTGGTIDKLESISGFDTQLSKRQFVSQIKRVGVAIISQSDDLVPADKKLYALRDVTGTVESTPLIAASVMSKKIATGAQAILLDIKVGNGAFMKDLNQGARLAKLMIAIGKHLGRNVWAHLTNMDQPLGRTIGNAIEVVEAVKAVRGEFIAADFKKIVYESAADLVLLGKGAQTKREALQLVDEVISSGKAYAKMLEWIGAQGGELALVENLERLFSPKHSLKIFAAKKGFVMIESALALGLLSVKLGAGREKKDDPVDHQAGIYLHKVTGEAVDKGQLLATLYSSRPIPAELANAYNQSVSIKSKTLKSPQLIYKRMTA